MTLLDAPAFDSRRARFVRNLSIAGVVLLVIAIAGTLLWFLQVPWQLWHWPSDHKINRFMDAVESNNLSEAYALWNNDPNWQQHPQQYQAYNFTQFQQDWGPNNSDYGPIHSYRIFVSHRVGNGVVIGLYINGNSKPLFLRVDGPTGTIGFSPIELYSGP